MLLDTLIQRARETGRKAVAVTFLAAPAARAFTECGAAVNYRSEDPTKTTRNLGPRRRPHGELHPRIRAAKPKRICGDVPAAGIKRAGSCGGAGDSRRMAKSGRASQDAANGAGPR